ncbi:MAG: PDR/VanB family oxidoreductase, partial [Caenispirillum bisanense]|nr:PDR/VanB family oxidoreductase [Caenispirillum bisanense]MCA1973265.1 PDR/VanB family oxidoreductase [Caenispirillum sp.]
SYQVKVGDVIEVRVAAVTPLAEGIVGLTLEDPRGRPLPRWSAGAHVDLLLGEYVRMYSLCGDAEDCSRLQVAVLHERTGRGGSAYVHERLKPGDEIRMRGPKNHFLLREDAAHYTLVAGGIGITPVLAMADRLKRLGKPYVLHYAGRRRATMAFLDRLARDHGDALHVYPADEGRRLDLPAMIAAVPDGGQVYACGPERLLDALAGLTADRPDVLHVEHFTATGTRLDPSREIAFDVRLADSGLTVHVPADQTVLHALRAVGVDVPSDCEEGLCGSCEVAVIDGEVDHRDTVLTAAERAENRRMMTCCSRARAGGLTLAL